jgi:monofunctional biosynthetic peptidoglycan transglycosylase
MTSYPFGNPKPSIFRRRRAHCVRGGAKPAPGRSIAFPAMGAREWIAYALQRVPVLLAGSALAFHLAVVLFFLGAGVIYSWLNPPVTSLMIERFVREGYFPRPVRFVPFAKLPGSVPAMYLKLEDKNFYRHPGIDPAAIAHAYAQNKRWGRVIMGGSTITQQLVRSLFLSSDKNYLRKYVEAIAAVSIDAVMDKKRIFELYLNYIEWGKGVYGLGTAAEVYFKKPADRLTYDEYAKLAAIIINPLSYDVNDFWRQPAMAARYYALTAPPRAEERPAPVGNTDAPAPPDDAAPPTAEDEPLDILP